MIINEQMQYFPILLTGFLILLGFRSQPDLFLEYEIYSSTETEQASTNDQEYEQE